MKYTTLIVLTVLLFLVCPVAQEGQHSYTDGNNLIVNCKVAVDFGNGSHWKDQDDAYNTGTCMGLVEGIAYVSPAVCVPNGVTIGQEVRVVLKYLEDKPQILNLNEAALTQNALSKAFPCKK